MKSPPAQTRVPVLALSMKGTFAVLLMSTLVWTFGAVACGVQEGQAKVDRAREVEKQMEERQHDLEKKLKDAGQKVEEGQ